VDRLRKDLDRFEQESRFLGDRKDAAPPILTIVAELTRLLPDDTWLAALRTRRDTVEIVGQSTAAAGLLRRIEEAALFRNANFSSPVTRADDNLERFNLTFELRTPLQTRTAQR
jgi:general secretion pathway protein L